MREEVGECVNEAATTTGSCTPYPAAEPAEVVVDDLVPRIRKVPQEAATLTGGINQGTFLEFLTPPKAFTNLARRLVFGERKGRFLPED